MQIGCIAGTGTRVCNSGLSWPQRHYMRRGMAAMVTGGVVPIVMRRVLHITRNLLMFCCSIAMAVKCPHRAVSSSADDKPYHENAFEHNESLHHLNLVFEKTGKWVSGPVLTA